MHGILSILFINFLCPGPPPEPLLISFANQKVIFSTFFPKTIPYFTGVRHFLELLVFYVTLSGSQLGETIDGYGGN